MSQEARYALLSAGYRFQGRRRRRRTGRKEETEAVTDACQLSLRKESATLSTPPSSHPSIFTLLFPVCPSDKGICPALSWSIATLRA